MTFYIILCMQRAKLILNVLKEGKKSRSIRVVHFKVSCLTFMGSDLSNPTG